MIVAIHQPNYLPWLGFFHKMHKSDVFVLLDDIQYTKGYVCNRNKIKTRQGWIWLTVPVLTKGKLNQQIKDTKINNRVHWGKKHWKSISSNYEKAEFFFKYSPFFKDLYWKEWDLLSDLNENIITYITKQLGINTEIVRASELEGVKGNKSDLLISICKAVGADTYLSGAYAAIYMEEKKFKENNLKLIYQKFKHPTYTQLWGKFIPQMSAIDLLFNEGPKSLEILSKNE